jgi:hypothetical protein
MTFKNIKSMREFKSRVAMLWSDDYEERELEAFPSSVLGGFFNYRRDEFLALARLHPEYHIVTCLSDRIFVNGFVEGGQSYYLAEGDPDPTLIYDPDHSLDLHSLYSLNSGSIKRIA